MLHDDLEAAAQALRLDGQELREQKPGKMERNPGFQRGDVLEVFKGFQKAAGTFETPRFFPFLDPEKAKSPKNHRKKTRDSNKVAWKNLENKRIIPKRPRKANQEPKNHSQ